MAHPKIDPSSPDFLPVPVAAKKTGTHSNTIRRMIARGELRAYRFGRLIRIDPRDLARAFSQVAPATYEYVSGGDGDAA